MSDADRAAEVLERLRDTYPEAEVELRYGNAFELLVATILSARCTDERVNRVTETLFRDYPDARAFAEADRQELEEAIRSTGFFRQKAKNIQGMSQALVERYDGEVPRELDDLTELPGVGRKTGNVVRAAAFDLPGIAVDTHCKRVSQRLELTTAKTPTAIERQLMELYPQEEWADLSVLFIWHGRYTCTSRKPSCDACCLPDLCPWFADHRA